MVLNNKTSDIWPEIRFWKESICVTVFNILVEAECCRYYRDNKSGLPGVIPTAILSPLIFESVSVASEKAPVVFRF